MGTAETYNGWANWETWSVHLWLTSSEAAYAIYQDLAGRAVAGADSTDDAAHALADMLRDEVPNVGIVGDSVSWHRVNWLEVARAAVEE